MAENFTKIQEAYELLSDPVKRKKYDRSLDETLASSMPCSRNQPEDQADVHLTKFEIAHHRQATSDLNIQLLETHCVDYGAVKRYQVSADAKSS